MNKFRDILFFLIILELVLGGGGRFTAIGPVSLRMVLFSLALLYVAYYFIKGGTIRKEYLQMLGLFGITIGIAALIGFLNDAKLALIFEDVKPLSYFLILPFFALTIKREDMGRISNIFIYGSLLLSLAYIILLVLINTSIIPFIDFYKFTSATEEFFYRGELAFVYKGFVFLCIGLIFIYFRRPKYSGLMAGIILLAMFLTFTRGFIFALTITTIVFLLTKPLNRRTVMQTSVMVIFAVLYVWKCNTLYTKLSSAIYKTEVRTNFTREFTPEKLLGDREFSNNERIRQFEQVMGSTTLRSSLIGHGFGNGVSVRPVHMEISYLEIFHKQGLIGLLFWLIIFLILTKKYLSTVKKEKVMSNAFYFGSLFIFIQSVTNQYFNNPIGLSFILVSFVSLTIIDEKRD